VKSTGTAKRGYRQQEEPGAGIRAERKLGFLIFAGLFLIYQSNLAFLPGDDATGNIFLPIAILKQHRISFSLDSNPFMFSWRKIGTQNADAQILSTEGWRRQVKDWPESMGYKLNELQVVEERYFIIRSTRENSYVNTFGIGAGLFALPFFALLDLTIGLEHQSVHFLWYAGKMVASLAVAGSAVMVFLIAARFCERRDALLLALAYGVGTCVWSISSQSLWQHGPVEFFLAMGAYFYFKPRPVRLDWFFVGLSWALASLCRPTVIVVVLIMGLWLVATDSRSFLPFALGAIPIGGLIGLYNWYFFSSALTFGQTERGISIALEKTGSAAVWQTPLLEGLAGLLISPSRGLFVYSPFLMFAAFGVCTIWKDIAFARFRPVTLSAGVLVVIAAKWFDWWGGWCYGYRPIVDLAPFLVLFLIPVMPYILNVLWRRALFAVFLVCSISVQFVGAFSYDLISWNDRNGMNIDRPEFRSRLWSLEDNQIWYYSTHFLQSSENKLRRNSD
jgi:hypothetical protein